MWPFQSKSKKTLLPTELPVDGSWVVGHGEHRGRVLMVRLNTGYEECRSVPGYDHLVRVVVPFRDPQATGLPLPQEDQELQGVEEALREALEAEAESLFVSVVTTDGMREFDFYSRDADAAKRRLGELQRRIETYELQITVELDKDWRFYSQLS